MKSRIIVCIALLHCMFFGFSQEPVHAGYGATEIAENLKKDANAVYRLDEMMLDVLSPSKYTMKVHQVITVLNAEGAHHLQQSVWLDKFNLVDDIEVKLYGSNGAELQKYKKKDFAIENYYDGISLATDDKLMRLSLSAPEYPCTVDVRYVVTVSAYIDLPNQYINNIASSVELFRYVVKVPADLDIRYRTLNMDLKPAIENNGKEKTYTWQAKNVAVNKLEAGGYEGRKYLPEVEVSPNVFEYDGHRGDFKTWSDFGKWCYSLYEEKNAFTSDRVSEIKALVNGLTDVDSKVKVLYGYLQKNMRYVSIQFGIGGYKPFTCKFVDDMKYGDCKALTNYMRNLLAVVGIKSYPALINAGYNKAPASPEFPENVFNHVILCVPRGNDSTWLECTSTNNAAGFLGSFTENKNALLLTENGGVMVPTPASDYKSNVLTTVNDIYLNADGGAEVKSRLWGTGSFYSLLNEVSKMEGERQNELFVNYLHYKEPDEFQLKQPDEGDKKQEFSTRVVYTKLFDFKAGDKYFFPRSVSRLCTERVIRQDDRKIEYLFDYPYKKVDTTIFHLPAGFTVDNLQQANELTNAFVNYKRDIIYDQPSNVIKITSTLALKKNIILPAEYKSVSELFYLIEKEEANKLVLKKG